MCIHVSPGGIMFQHKCIVQSLMSFFGDMLFVFLAVAVEQGTEIDTGIVSFKSELCWGDPVRIVVLICELTYAGSPLIYIIGGRNACM